MAERLHGLGRHLMSPRSHGAGRIGDGGKWVCGMRMLQEMKHCLVYSLGSQGDTSFEDEFLERTICEV